MAELDRVYELRTYIATPGKRDALEARFRDHTLKLFAKHGIELEGFFVPYEGGEDTLVYLISFPSREQATASWAAFQADPEWLEAKRESEVDGPLTVKIESLFLTATLFSPTR
jgi:hypothetical protein